MRLHEALETYLPLRRHNKLMSYTSVHTEGVTHIKPGTWLDHNFIFSVQLLTITDAMADDWEVKEETKTVNPDISAMDFDPTN